MPELVYRKDEIEEVLIKILPKIMRQVIVDIKEEKRARRLNMKQAAVFLGMHVNTFSSKLKSGEIPLSLRHGEGRNKYYLSTELDDYQKKS